MSVGRLVVLLAVVAVGCTRSHTRRPQPAPARLPDPVPVVPVPTPPPPPSADPPPVVADSPGVPDPTVQPAGHTADAPRPGPQRTPAPASAPPTVAPASDAAARLVAAAAARWATVPDFEARFIKREVANGKPVPESEMVYRYRQVPHSVYMKVVGGAGEGREVLYVQGRFGGKMHLVTGLGDSLLAGVGYKTELDPHDKQATAKSRYKVTEAGFGRVIGGLTAALAAGKAVTALGPTTRPEHPYPLDGIQVVCQPGDDPLLPRGGTRHIFFDPKPESPSFRLPVLVVCREPDGREVEYYSFDRFKVPSGWTDADWAPARLKK